MADVPPELAAEVEKLERLHAENPQGRYLVPLADAYRKSGELESAEALLREGLRRNPGSLTAHIVLGRCLAERRASDEATAEFRHVLSVDPQNLIALRSLGDIAVDQRQPDEAARWYRELLSVDPRNEDARLALDALEASPDLDELDSTTEPSPPPLPVASDSGAELSWGDLTLDSTGAELPEAAPDPFASTSFGEVELGDDLAPAAEDDATGSWDPMAGGTIQLDPPSLGSTEPEEGEELVTETIAELYARQGFFDRAADAYRELLRRRGEDADLRARLEEVERLARGEEASEVPDAGPSSAVSEDAAAGADLSFGDLTLASSPAANDAGDASESFAATFDSGFGDVGSAPPAATRADAPDVFGHLDLDPGAGGDTPGEARAEPDPFGSIDLDVSTGWEAPESVAGMEFGNVELGSIEPAMPESAGVEPGEPAAVGGFALDAAPAGIDEARDAVAPTGTASVRQYFATLLSWSPASGAAPAAVVEPGPAGSEAAPAADDGGEVAWSAPAAADEGATGSAGSGDLLDLGAATSTPEVGASDAAPLPDVGDFGFEPAEGGPDTVASSHSPDDEPWVVAPDATSAPASPEDDEPWAVTPEAASATPSPVDDEPWALTSDDGSSPSAADAPAAEPATAEWELPTHADPPSAASGGAGDEAESLPWEMEPAAGDPVETPSEGEAADQGFSFEEFFTPADPAPAPAPAPAAPAAADDAGGEDEDLESFQAWLQSLKR